MMFPMVYNLVKHFLCEETKRKMVILGGTIATLYSVTVSSFVHNSVKSS